MKVTMESDYKHYYTLEDVDNAKAVIKYEKQEDQESSAKDWFTYAVNEALKDNTDSLREILTASAHTAKNARVYDAYGDTYNMDVWIEGVARTTAGYIEVGAYLTDIWQTGSTPYKEHEYIRYFKEAAL